jgi:hypothetical protein
MANPICLDEPLLSFIPTVTGVNLIDASAFLVDPVSRISALTLLM